MDKTQKENARDFMNHELAEAAKQFKANAPEGTERGYIIISYEMSQLEDGKAQEGYVGCQLGGLTGDLVTAVLGVLNSESSEENPTSGILKIAMRTYLFDKRVSSEIKTFAVEQLDK